MALPENSLEYLVYFAPLIAATGFFVKLYLDSAHNKRASMIMAFSEIMNQIGNDKIRECRDKIRKSDVFEEIPKKDSKELKNALPEISKELDDAARNVAITYDRLGFILRRDKKLEKEIFKMHGDVIVEMWTKLKPYVLYKWAKKYKRYATYFQEMGEKAIAYEKDHPPKNRE